MVGELLRAPRPQAQTQSAGGGGGSPLSRLQARTGTKVSTAQDVAAFNQLMAATRSQSSGNQPLWKKVGGTILRTLQGPQSAIFSLGEGAVNSIADMYMTHRLGKSAWQDVKAHATTKDGKALFGFGGMYSPGQLVDDLRNGKPPSEMLNTGAQVADEKKWTGGGAFQNPFVKIGVGLTADIATDPLTFLAPEAGLSKLGKSGVAIKAGEEAALAARAARGLREGEIVAKDAETATQAVRGVDYASEADKVRAGMSKAAGLKPSVEASAAATELEAKAARLQRLAMKAGTGKMGASLTKGELEEVTGMSGGIKFNAPGTGWIGRKLGVAKLIDRAAADAREPLQGTIMARNALTAAPGRLIEGIGKGVKATKLGESIANALGGASPELRQIMRSTNDPAEWTKALLGKRATRLGRLATRGAENDLFKMAQDSLRDVKGKVPDETIVAAMRGDQASADAVRAAGGDRALSMFEEMRQHANQRIGFEAIPQRENYFPRIVKTAEGDQIYPETGRIFNKAGIEKQAVKPGDEFLGRIIDHPSAGKTVEQQMSEAVQAAGGAAGELSHNLPEGVSYWVRNAARRVGEEHARDLMVRWNVAEDGIKYVGNSNKLKLLGERDMHEALLAGLQAELHDTRAQMDVATGAGRARALQAQAGQATDVANHLSARATELEGLIRSTEQKVELTRQMVEGSQRQVAAADSTVSMLGQRINTLTSQRDELLSKGGDEARVLSARTQLEGQIKQAQDHMGQILSNPLMVEHQMRSVVLNEKEAAYVRAVAQGGDDRLVERVVSSLPTDIREQSAAAAGQTYQAGTDPLRSILHEYAGSLERGASDSAASLRTLGRPVPTQAEAESIRKYLPRYRDQVQAATERVVTLDPTNPGYADSVKALADAQRQSNEAHMAMELYDIANRRIPAEDVFAQDRIVKAMASNQGVSDLLAARKQTIDALVINPDQLVNQTASDVTNMVDQAAAVHSPAGLNAMMQSAGELPASTHSILLGAQQYSAQYSVPFSEALDAQMFAGAGNAVDIGAYRQFKEEVAQALGVNVDTMPTVLAPNMLREVFAGKPLQSEIAQLERELGVAGSRHSQLVDRMIQSYADKAGAEADLRGLYETPNSALGEAVTKKIDASRWLGQAAEWRRQAHEALKAGVIDASEPNWLEKAAERATLEGKLNQLTTSVKAQDELLRKAVNQLGTVGSQADGFWRKILKDGMKDFSADYWQGASKTALMPERGTMADARLADTLVANTKMVGSNSEFLRYYNGFTQLWKRMAITYPGFAMRHTLGGAYNNWLGGVAHESWMEFAHGYSAMPDPEKLAKLAQEDPKMSRFLELWHEAGGVTGGQTVAEISPGHMFVPLRARINPFSSDFAPVAGMRKLTTWVENHTRGSMAWDTMRTQWDPVTKDFAEGAMQRTIDRVDKFHYDYSDMSPFENGVLRRTIFPFYAFSRKNIPLQFEMMVSNPAKALRYFKIKDTIEKQSTPDNVTPPFLDDLFAIRLPFSTGDGAGHQFYMPQIPVGEAFMATDWKYWAGAVNPIIKTPIELAAGTRIQTQLPFKDTYSQAPAAWQDIPGLMQGLQGVGLAKAGNDGNYYTSDRDAYVVEQALPVLGRVRRLLPSEQRYQSRGMAAWLGFLGISTNANTQDEQDLYGSIARIDEKNKAKAQKNLPQALGGYKPNQ